MCQIFTPSSHFTTDDYLNGVLIPIDKPYRWTSADVVRKVKFALQKYTRIKNIKVGHAGTLDPLATGLLLLCVGKATKQAEALQAEMKEYIAQIELGATTPSFDLEKEIDAYYPFEHITREALETALVKFVGTHSQIPPVFSAKVIDGTRAYELARAGKETAMKPAAVTIYEIELLSFTIPTATVRLRCSKGTYVRAFARDLGEALQSGAHLSGLQRTQSGNFNMLNAWNLEDLIKKIS